MKEKINKICLTASMVTGLICFTGCSDDFLKDKKYMEAMTLRLCTKIMKQPKVVWTFYISLYCLVLPEVQCFDRYNQCGY
mgnify:CR=1 FL=1